MPEASAARWFGKHHLAAEPRPARTRRRADTPRRTERWRQAPGAGPVASRFAAAGSRPACGSSFALRRWAVGTACRIQTSTRSSIRHSSSVSAFGARTQTMSHCGQPTSEFLRNGTSLQIIVVSDSDDTSPVCPSGDERPAARIGATGVGPLPGTVDHIHLAHGLQVGFTPRARSASGRSKLARMASSGCRTSPGDREHTGLCGQTRAAVGDAIAAARG